jgi:predicted nucleic acid-binding protein
MSIGRKSRMSKAYVLDAWALLAFLQGEEPAAARVGAIIEKAGKGSLRLMISIVNLGEVYYRIGRTRGPAEANEALDSLNLLPWEILPADNETVIAAARLKMMHTLSYADAFAAIAAQAHKATLLTGDLELIALAGQIEIEKLTRTR